MTDYKRLIESKLAELDRRRAEIESERERLSTTIEVLNALDAYGVNIAERPTENPTRPDTLTGAILHCLTVSESLMTPAEIHEHLSRDREVKHNHLYSALHRLKKRNKIFKVGKMWGLTERATDASASKVAEHSGKEQVTSLYP